MRELSDSANNRTVRVAPIGDDDVPGAAQFLQENMNRRIPAGAWRSLLVPSWTAEGPNRGFMLLDADAIVGVQAALYSQRRIDGEIHRFCNLAALCVLEEYRLHSLRLLKAVLAQDGYHFTDLSPSGNVVRLNTKLNFQMLDTATALIPNLPWPAGAEKTRVVSDPQLIESMLSGSDLEIYRDHARAAAAHHLMVWQGAETCYIMFRRDRRKNMPLFASLLHIGNPRLFHHALRDISRHLLLRFGILALLAEIRVVGFRPPLSVMVPAARPKMYRSDRLRADQVDYLYSELTCLAW
jgi:hypothetical protein